MSILDKSEVNVIDDTEKLTATITGAETKQNHTVFVIKVQRGVSKDNVWTVRRRYSDFVAMYESLKISGVEMTLPPKKLLGNMEREFIAERQAGLHHMLNNEILSHPLLAACEIVKRFLDETNYKRNQVELSLQFVSMFLRSEPDYELVEPCKEFGVRIRKCFFMVRPKQQPKQRFLLSWTQFGPDRLLQMKDLVSGMKLLPNIQHPSIETVNYASASENGVLVIRPFHKDGSIRDRLCKTRPMKISYLKRYCSPRSSGSFTLPEVRQYGRQILEAVRFLHDKGLAHHHLHAGNVVIEKDICKLVDIETYFIGAPPFYKTFYSNFRKIHSSESIDVYSFGHLLYEMFYGCALNKPTIDNLPPDSPALIRSVLESILSVEACKNGLPTLEALLTHTLFMDETVSTVGIKPQLKIPTKLKDAYRQYKEAQERKLKEEQKLISQARRLSKAKAHHSSDKERQRRKLEARKKSMKNLDLPEEDKSASKSSTATSPSSPTTPEPVTSSVPPPPPPPPPANIPPPPPPPAPQAAAAPPSGGGDVGRTALLGSITSFNKTKLKKQETIDKSAPRI